MILFALEEPEEADLTTPDALVAYLAAHPDTSGLIVFTMDADGNHAPSGSLSYSADTARPLASTQKLVVLLAYAQSVAAGQMDPDATVPRADWEAWYLPGTDGGAHPAALARLDPDGDPTVDQLASAMITESDNAATDLLLTLLPPGALEAAGALAETEVPHSLMGDILTLRGADPCAETHDEAVRRSSALAEEWRRGGGDAPRLPAVREQRRRLACVETRGTPRAYATLQGQVGAALLPLDVVTVMRRHLEWPMKQPGTAEAFERFGGKGGSVPGVLTDSLYLVPRQGPYAGQTRVVALFLEDLSGTAWLTLMSSFAHQKLMIELATDPDRVSEVAGRLGDAP